MSLWKQILTAFIYQVYILIFFLTLKLPLYDKKALISRLFLTPFVTRFLGFYQQSYTLNMMRLRKKIHRLDFLQFVAQLLVEFDITRHGCHIT